MLWDPFLIKKLLKSVICGTVNSARMHCSQLTKSTIAAEPKKKKKREKRSSKNVDAEIIWIQTVTLCEMEIVTKLRGFINNQGNSVELKIFYSKVGTQLPKYRTIE